MRSYRRCYKVYLLMVGNSLFNLMKFTSKSGNYNFITLCYSQLRPPMMSNLLKKMAVDVPALNENTVVPLRVSMLQLNCIEKIHSKLFYCSLWKLHSVIKEMFK